jgi:thiamine-phosphate diphosphorylase/hydroxyethylthiazole kinase
MSNNADEAEDLARLGGSLVINMGTVTPDMLEAYVRALKAYNTAGQPVIFDPVGYAAWVLFTTPLIRANKSNAQSFPSRAGATQTRRSAVQTILGGGYLDVIKGNEGEIQTVFSASSSAQQRGVDSTSTLSHGGKARLVRRLAERERTVVVMTGETDYLSDGCRTFAASNGHEYLGMITGTGCVLGTTISAMVAVHPGDKLLAAIAGVLLFSVAGEMAAARQDVQGPGSFQVAFVDELARLTKATAGGDLRWLQIAKLVKVAVGEEGEGED